MAASWQSRLAIRLIRWHIKDQPRPKGPALVPRARELFGDVSGKLGWIFHLLARITPVDAAGVRGEWQGPRGGARTGRVLYYLHGGGYIACSPKTHRVLSISLARRIGGRAFSLDYRLAPEHPFPAALDDAVAGYRWLLVQGVRPERIAIAGDSAGGGLVLATLVKLRDMGLPMPACAFVMSPWTDLAGTGDSVRANEATDAMFFASDLPLFTGLYLNGASPQTPTASPLYADPRGLPPLLFHVSEAEILLDDSRRFHDRALAAGVTSRLKSWAEMPHVWHLLHWLVPEAEAAMREAVAFLNGEMRSTR